MGITMTTDLFSTTLSETLLRLGLDISSYQIVALRTHFERMVEANQRFNLTRITDPTDAAVRLYADSAMALVWADRIGLTVNTVLDVGTGAGFPSLPLAVLAPHWQITALEATGKKADFVASCAEQLQISNLRSIHGHTSHWPDSQTFDLVIFKAVGSLSRCLSLAHLRVRVGGYVVIHKTLNIQSEEIQAGRQTADQLGFEEQPTLSLIHI